MGVCIYSGGYETVKKSGVGKALEHQRAALQAVGIPLVEQLPSAGESARSCVVHLNTVLPDTRIAAMKARARGCKIIYYGHSTMEDFRNSFTGSNLVAPLFKKWICSCYNSGDVIITPSEYSKNILLSYGLKKPIYALSNGIDTSFFCPSAERAARFRAKYHLAPEQKCAISVGHWMVRKGLPDFVELARRMPEVQFLWFGYTDAALLTPEIKIAMDHAPSNLTFAGFADAEDLCDAYCGADAFVFLSHEETEGIVILEALACGTPTLLRDIPVYSTWLKAGESAYMDTTLDGFEEKLKAMLNGTLPPLTTGGHAVADARSLRAIGEQLCRIYEENGFLEAAKA